MQMPQSRSALWLTEASDPPGDEPAWEDNKSHTLQIIVIIIRFGKFPVTDNGVYESHM